MEKNILYKTKKINLTTSIWFLFFVIFVTAWLFFYNSFLENKSQVLREEIRNLDSSISEIQKDKDLQIYNLIVLNKNSIDLLKKNSEVTKFINHLKVISSKYDLDFGGFNYSNGILSTSVELVSDEKNLAYNKATNFLSSYRKESEALFELDFVNNITGYDRMKFNVKFNVK